MIRVELPFAPPLSACFSDFVYRSKHTGKWTARRVETKRYKDWQAEALKMIAYQMPKGSFTTPAAMMGEVQVMVRLVAPDKRERDAGNMDKAIMDIIVKAKLIENDSNRYVRRLTFAWADDGVPCVVFIKPVPPVQPELALGDAT